VPNFSCRFRGWALTIDRSGAGVPPATELLAGKTPALPEKSFSVLGDEKPAGSALRLQSLQQALELRVALQAFEVGVLLHPFEIGVAELDGPVERAQRVGLAL